MTKYWDFDNDKVGGGVHLVADWRVKKITLAVTDSAFLESDFAPYGTLTSGAGFPIKYSRYGHMMYFYKGESYTTDPGTNTVCWAQCNIIHSNTFSLGDDYGMKADDLFGIQSTTSLSPYCAGVTRVSDPWVSFITYSGGWSVNNKGGNANFRLLGQSEIDNRGWQMYVTVAIPRPTTGIPFTTDYSVGIFHYRTRNVEVDYGTTVGSFLSNPSLPKTWKRPDKGVVAAPANWIIQNGDFVGKKLSEVPANTQFTAYTMVKVTY